MFDIEPYDDYECQHTITDDTPEGLRCRKCGAIYDEYTLEWKKDSEV